MALQAYADAHGGHYPERLEDLRLNDPGVLVCRSASKGTSPAYIYRGKGLTSPVREELIIAHEPLSNHGTCICVLYGDGSADLLMKPWAELIPGLLDAPPDSAPPVAPAVAHLQDAQGCLPTFDAALRRYARDHQQRHPGSLEELIADGYLKVARSWPETGYLVSEEGMAKLKSLPFVYTCAGQHRTTDAKAVVLYQYLPKGLYVEILFGDGRTSTLSVEEAHQRLGLPFRKGAGQAPPP